MRHDASQPRVLGVVHLEQTLLEVWREPRTDRVHGVEHSPHVLGHFRKASRDEQRAFDALPVVFLCRVRPVFQHGHPVVVDGHPLEHVPAFHLRPADHVTDGAARVVGLGRVHERHRDLAHGLTRIALAQRAFDEAQDQLVRDVLFASEADLRVVIPGVEKRFDGFVKQPELHSPILKYLP